MLTLTLNYIPIPLPPDFSMQLTWKNPATNFEQIPSGYGLGISIPINEFTRPLFGFPERFSKYRASTGSATGQKFPGCEIRFGGVLLMAGTLVINGASPSTASRSGGAGNYEASLIDEIGVLGEKERERNILEMQVMKTAVGWVRSMNYNPDDNPYCCFPVRNNGFFREKGASVTRNNPPTTDGSDPGTYDVEVLTFLFIKTFGTVNANDLSGYIFQSDSDIDLTYLDGPENSYEDTAGRVTVISPFFFLNKIIADAFRESQFFLNANFLDTEASLRNVCIYNNYDITKTDFGLDGVWREVKDKPTISYGQEGDVVVEDGWHYVFTGGGTAIKEYKRRYTLAIIPKNHLPKMKLGELILSTQNLFNVCFHFLPNKTINVLSREDLITGTAFDLDRYFVGEWAVGEQKNVALKFTREHDDKDLIFSERWTDLSDRRDDIKAPVVSMSNLIAIAEPSEGEIRYVRDYNAYFEYRILTDEEIDPASLTRTHTDILGWREISIGMQDGWYEYGREEVEEIKTAWSSLYEDDFVAQADQAGSMNMMKEREQSFSPRLLISKPYNEGGTKTNDFSFEYETPSIGILAKFWKNWNPFWANRLEVSGEFDLPVNVLRHLVYNICQKYRTREGEFMIDEMSCEIFIDRIGVTEVKGFKV